jgi:hypothetical protein
MAALEILYNNYPERIRLSGIDGYENGQASGTPPYPSPLRKGRHAVDISAKTNTKAPKPM